MKYLDGFRDADAARALSRRIERLANGLDGRRVTVMEVCGTHTMAIARFGIRDLLPSNVELVSGPGCPVCVTDPGYIDAAVRIASDGAVLATFGDMLHVPGSRSDLAACRSRGADVTVCYSPLAALDLAERQANRQVVFLGVGFETTMAPIVGLIERARRRGTGNLSVLTALKRVPPALLALAADPSLQIDAFLCPAHVSAIIGSNAYLPFACQHGLPCVVAGFEPLDILLGLQGILEQIAAGTAEVDNQYSRVVKPAGNTRAQALLAKHLRAVDAAWRGFGVLPDSGSALRPEYRSFDAEARLGIAVAPGREQPGCRCGDVVKGKLRPPECPLFAGACAPEHPIGPCMVSSEGTCAAWFKYSRLSP